MPALRTQGLLPERGLIQRLPAGFCGEAIHVAKQPFTQTEFAIHDGGAVNSYGLAFLQARFYSVCAVSAHRPFAGGDLIVLSLPRQQRLSGAQRRAQNRRLRSEAVSSYCERSQTARGKQKQKKKKSVRVSGRFSTLNAFCYAKRSHKEESANGSKRIPFLFSGLCRICASSCQIFGMLISTSLPASADFAMPSRIAWL